MTDAAAEEIARGVKNLLSGPFSSQEMIVEYVSAALREVRIKEQDRCCKIIYGQCSSDNAAERTVRAIRSGVNP